MATGGDSSLTGLAAALLHRSGGRRPPTVTPGQQQPGKSQLVARPEALASYWTTYLRQMQLGQHAASPSLAAVAGTDAVTAHAQLLHVLSAAANSTSMPSSAVASSNGALAAPKAMRLQDTPSSTPLSDLAVALQKQRAAPLPGMSSMSAFSLAGGSWGTPQGDPGSGGGSPSASGPATVSRQGSDGLRRGASGSLHTGSRFTPGPGATSKRTGKRSARDIVASDVLPFKKRHELNHAPSFLAAEASSEEGAEMALVRMRSGELPALPLGSDGSGLGEEPTTLVANSGPKCSKEKNRQAQRRFRERQKTLISDLRDSVRTLQADAEAQAKQIFVLQEENRLLKMLLNERQSVAPSQNQTERQQGSEQDQQ